MPTLSMHYVKEMLTRGATRAEQSMLRDLMSRHGTDVEDHHHDGNAKTRQARRPTETGADGAWNA